jgi:hypothetical protein
MTNTEVTPMTKDDIIAQLSRPFSKEELRTRPGQGGMTFTYADAAAVIARLNEVLGGAWDFEADLIQPQPAVVKGTLVVHFPDGSVARRVDYGYPNGERDQEPVKSAQSDALRRCARMVGVGLYLYSRTPGAKPSPRAETVAPAPAVKKTELINNKTPKMIVEDIGVMTSELLIDYNVDLMPKIIEAIRKEGAKGLLELPNERIAVYYNRVAEKLAEVKKKVATA